MKAFEYPRNPAGLEPDTLFADAVHGAWLRAQRLTEPPLDAAVPPDAAAPPPDAAAPRKPRSKYVGVFYHRADPRSGARWRGQMSRPTGAINGPVHPLTDAGELEAAWDYARMKGLPGPLLRKV